MKKEYDFRSGKKGAVVTPAAGKTRITIRWMRTFWRGSGVRYTKRAAVIIKTLINQALRAHINERPESRITLDWNPT